MNLSSAVLIAGATATGKSMLAMRLAEAVGGVVINADSMQVYSDLRILTARPSPADESQLPHRLYGYLDGAVAGSVSTWLLDLENVLGEVSESGLIPIVAGGTGLYLRAALEGLAPVPDIPGDIRETVRQRALDEGPERLHQELSKLDPAMAARLKLGDTQRICRALEVVLSTGHSLLEWQQNQPETTLGALDKEGRVLKCVATWPRYELLERCDSRLDHMASSGALEEVEALLSRGLDPDLPVMKALGVSAFAGYLEGEYDLATAIGVAQMQTHQYVKRQITWFRNQFRWWSLVDAQNSDRLMKNDFPAMCDFVESCR